MPCFQILDAGLLNGIYNFQFQNITLICIAGIEKPSRYTGLSYLGASTVFIVLAEDVN